MNNNNMHIDNTPEGGIAGVLITVLLGSITFTDVEVGTKIMASIATFISASVVVYFQFKNNRKKPK
jgi:hypothetical protein